MFCVCLVLYISAYVCQTVSGDLSPEGLFLFVNDDECVWALMPQRPLCVAACPLVLALFYLDFLTYLIGAVNFVNCVYMQTYLFYAACLSSSSNPCSVAVYKLFIVAASVICLI